MLRIVFFGLDGTFATIPLNALARAGMRPILVIRGRSEEPRPWRPAARRIAAQPTWWTKLTGATPDVGQSPNDLAHAAGRLGIDTIDTSNANRKEVLQAIRRLKPDAFVIAGFEHLLSRTALSIPRFGGLNIHPGQLPDERGAAPLFWALRGGRTELHWTIHMLDAGEDTGDVITSGQIQIEPGTDGLVILERMAQAATPALVKAVRALVAGDLVRQPQPESGAARKRRPKFEDGKIDISKPAHAVYTFVGGCSGRYSIFAEVANDRFFIRRALSYDPDADLDFDFVLMGDRLLLRCNPGMVELELKEHGALFSAEY
ncbi:MAG: formyltransferase family protein [Myxococcota bacterium]